MDSSCIPINLKYNPKKVKGETMERNHRIHTCLTDNGGRCLIWHNTNGHFTTPSILVKQGATLPQIRVAVDAEASRQSWGQVLDVAHKAPDLIVIKLEPKATTLRIGDGVAMKAWNSLKLSDGKTTAGALLRPPAPRRSVPPLAKRLVQHSKTRR